MKLQSRRDFIKYAGIGVAGSTLFPSLGKTAQSVFKDLGKEGKGRPNVVFVLADDMRWDVMSCAGNSVLKTPALDRLATGGTRFQNAFVTTSICAVSRACILTGQHACRHGVNDFRTPLRSLDGVYPTVLRQNGYYTGFIGKWGINENDRAYYQRCAREYDFWAGDMEQAAYWHDRDCNYIRNNGTTERANFFCSCPQAAQARNGCDKNKGPHPSLKNPIHETEFAPGKVRSFLDQRDTAKPFCLAVSLKSPHGPWCGYAPRFEKDFNSVDIPMRGNVALAEALRQPEFLRKSLESEHGLELMKNPSRRNALLRQYYRLIEGIDFCMGEIQKELQQRGLADNTVLIFSSDNGHFATEHGFWGKWFMHEESLRVPLLIYDPRAPVANRGQTLDAMALNIDIAPTILDLAGLPAPAAMQGQSLLPVMCKPDAPLRDAFFYQHLYANSPKPPKHIEPSEGVRTRDWKYMHWLGQAGPASEELYDLRADSLETKNLATDPAYAAQLDELRKQCQMFKRELK